MTVRRGAALVAFAVASMMVSAEPGADEFDETEVQAFLFMVMLANGACTDEGKTPDCDTRVRKALSDLCEATRECTSATDVAALAADIFAGASDMEELMPGAFEALDRIAAGED